MLMAKWQILSRIGTVLFEIVKQEVVGAEKCRKFYEIFRKGYTINLCFVKV